MDPIMDLSECHGISVIEDCAQAHGALYKGRSVGTIGHIGAWSFCQDKIMTTGGEGGMVTTNDEKLWRCMWSFKDHGKNYDAVYNKNHHPGFRWVHDSIGTNWRMLEMQGVIGRIQLKRMQDWNEKRSLNSLAIKALCKNFSFLRVPDFNDNLGTSVHAYYKCYVYIDQNVLSSNWSRDLILDELNKSGLPCLQGSCPEIYLEKAFDGTGLRPKVRLPNAKVLGETSLMFPVHPTITKSQMSNTISILEEVFLKVSP